MKHRTLHDGLQSLANYAHNHSLTSSTLDAIYKNAVQAYPSLPAQSPDWSEYRFRPGSKTQPYTLADLKTGALTPNVKKRLRDGVFNDRLGIKPTTPPHAPLKEPRDDMEGTLIDLPGMASDFSSGISQAMNLLKNVFVDSSDTKFTPILPIEKDTTTPTPTPTTPIPTPPIPTTPTTTTTPPQIEPATQLPFYGGHVPVPTPTTSTQRPSTQTPTGEQTFTHQVESQSAQPPQANSLPPRRDDMRQIPSYDFNPGIDFSRFESTRPRDFDVSEYMSNFGAGLAQGAVSGIIGQNLLGGSSLFGVYNTFENILRSNSQADALRNGRLLGEKARFSFAAASPENAINHVSSVSISSNRISPDVTAILAPQDSRHQSPSGQSPQNNVDLLRTDFVNHFQHASAPFAV